MIVTAHKIRSGSYSLQWFSLPTFTQQTYNNFQWTLYGMRVKTVYYHVDFTMLQTEKYDNAFCDFTSSITVLEVKFLYYLMKDC